MKPLADALTEITKAQLRTVNRHVGRIADRDIDAVWQEAEALHHAQLGLAPHPIDGSIPADLHNWAIRGIAINLVARDLGFDAAKITYDQPSAPPLELTPPRRV